MGDYFRSGNREAGNGEAGPRRKRLASGDKRDGKSLLAGSKTDTKMIKYLDLEDAISRRWKQDEGRISSRLRDSGPDYSSPKTPYDVARPFRLKRAEGAMLAVARILPS